MPRGRKAEGISEVFEAVEPSEIRKESLTFQQAVIRQMDRIGRFAPNSVVSGKGLERYEVLAIYSSIRILECFLSPYVNDEYKETTKDIKTKMKFDRLDNKDYRYEFLDILWKWLDEIVKQFARVDILPAIREVIMMGDQEEKEE